MRLDRQNIILIAGPSASGKTKLAKMLAQCYDTWTAVNFHQYKYTPIERVDCCVFDEVLWEHIPFIVDVIREHDFKRAIIVVQTDADPDKELAEHIHNEKRLRGELVECFITSKKPHVPADLTVFNRALKELGDLYEEGKDCLHSMSILNDEMEHRDRLYEILRELRDAHAVLLQTIHGVIL